MKVANLNNIICILGSPRKKKIENWKIHPKNPENSFKDFSIKSPNTKLVIKDLNLFTMKIFY
jgi:hypothetical protein